MLIKECLIQSKQSFQWRKEIFLIRMFQERRLIKINRRQLEKVRCFLNRV